MNKKINILNIGFNPTNYDQLVDFLTIKANRSGYVCFPDLYNIILANRTIRLKEVYQKSTLTLSDGKPSQLLIQKHGYPNTTTISGYWLCTKLLQTECSHYFYGTHPENLILMQKNITKRFPNANILGFKSPPIVEIDELQFNSILIEDIKMIKELNPDFIWIGVGSPKQDYLMHLYHQENSGSIMLGVGAVFDYFAGKAKMGPEFLKKIGMRWLYQTIIDPKRYLKRLIYILRNMPFLIKLYFGK